MEILANYDQYTTNERLEKEGKQVLLAEETIRATLARAGGANERFDKTLTANSKPYMRAINAGKLGKKKANEILWKTYAESVVLNWETLVKEDDEIKFVKGVHIPGEKVLRDVTKDNLMMLWKARPELFNEINEYATQLSSYQDLVREEAEKN